MARLLVIDTSSPLCTVAFDGPQARVVKQVAGARAHGRLLLKTIEEVLEQQRSRLQDLDALAVVSGPGSFTGIRIGVSVVQGLSLALDKPVVLLSSLEWLARSALNKQDFPRVLVCMQAGNAECYWATFVRRSDSTISRLTGEQVGDVATLHLPRDFESRTGNLGVGDGWQNIQKQAPALTDRFAMILPDLQPDADTLCELASQQLAEQGGVPAERAIPSYLKENMQYRTVT